MTVEQKNKLIEEMEKLLADFVENKNDISKQQFNGMRKALKIIGYKVEIDDDMEKVIITEMK